MREYFGCGLGM